MYVINDANLPTGYKIGDDSGKIVTLGAKNIFFPHFIQLAGIQLVGGDKLVQLHLMCIGYFVFKLA